MRLRYLLLHLYLCNVYFTASGQVTTIAPIPIIIQNVTVDGDAIVTSHNYPGLVITSIDKNPDYYDWQLNSKTPGNGLLFFFDRIDFVPEGLYNGGAGIEKAYLCQQSEYQRCSVTASQGIPCYCTQEINSLHVPYEIKWDQLPVFLVFRPIIPVAEYYPYPTLARAGYRATVLEYDNLNRRFFQCGSTIDISGHISPLYLISQDFPKNTQMFRECVVIVKSNEGIRVKIQQIQTIKTDILQIQGKTPDGQVINYNATNPPTGFVSEPFHFVNQVTYTIHMAQATLDEKSFFVIQNEYMVLSATNETTVSVNLTGHYSLQTQGYGNTTYPNNVKTNYKFKMPLNHQFEMHFLDFDLEESCDFFYGNLTGRLTGSDEIQDYYYSEIGIKEVEFTFESDELEGLKGFNIDVNGLDCDCGQTNITIFGNFSQTFSMPVNPNQKTYCRGISCTYTLTPHPEIYMTVEFTQEDIDGEDQLTILQDEWPNFNPNVNQTLVFFNEGTVINFTSREIPLKYGHRGFSFVVKAAKPPTRVIDLCDDRISFINENVSPGLHEVRQFTVKSCRGRIGVQLLSDDSADIELYDGPFNGVKLNVSMTSPVIASGQLISIRLKSLYVAVQTFTLVLSDSFADENGVVCGGFSNTTIRYTSDGCIQFYYGYFDSLVLDGPPLRIYRGFSVNETYLIPGTATVPLNLYSNSNQAPITFIVPKGYTGGQLNLSASDDFFPTPANGYILIASADFFNWDCGFSGCGLDGYLTNPTNKTANVQFELLASLGTSHIYLNKYEYNGCAGLLNITVPSTNTPLTYASGYTDGYLLAKVYLTTAPPTLVTTTTTPSCLTTTSLKTTSQTSASPALPTLTTKPSPITTTTPTTTTKTTTTTVKSTSLITPSPVLSTTTAPPTRLPSTSVKPPVVHTTPKASNRIVTTLICILVLLKILL